GQANRITAATGGTYVSGIVAGTIVDTITGLVEGAVADINQVTLVPTAEIAPFVTSIDPAAYGPLDGNVSHSLDFDVTFTGTHCGLAGPEEFNGSLDVMVDGSKVGEKTVKITVPGCNVAPTDLALVCQLTPVAINTPATLSFSFTDPDATDAHDVDIAWDDTTSSHIDLAAGVTAGAADHTYTAVGVYQPTVTVTDSFGETVEATCENYIVVFDPNGGFVTGGGWIDTAAGSYPADPTLDGRANFGFVSKYKKGQIVPTGSTEFQFHATDFNFHSEDYEWLIVSGSKAQFKGTGTINGEGSYKFMVTATDGGTGKTATPDTFRIKITDGSTVVYDNKLGGSDEFGAAPTQDIGSGSIVIHK
ncbi:MAG TPA: post-COAP-1 domain-containing protein, partial [Microthrixaceae bacterium]|nr:post-COAP-1 domain-containing protein [Microthrixaceae bacterium]